jgi:hypothetical protein
VLDVANLSDPDALPVDRHLERRQASDDSSVSVRHRPVDRKRVRPADFEQSLHDHSMLDERSSELARLLLDQRLRKRSRQLIELLHDQSSRYGFVFVQCHTRSIARNTSA